ncbi:MAG: amino acid ABC transporter substrate-binding protein [Chloroflexi bacterium]|nr:amino acid ABC transporter substrate-binding protein [Chloroflexota bacterium]
MQRTFAKHKIFHWLLPILALMAGIIWLQRHQRIPLWQEDQIWARIQREGLLRVGMDASYPPFEEALEEGQFVGLDVDLAQALAARWGVQVLLVNVHFDGLYDALKAGKFDLIISALPYDRTMTRDLLYSNSYFDAGQVLLMRSDRDDIRKIDGLEGARVAVELGSEGHHLAHQLSRDKALNLYIEARRELEEATELVLDGEADVLICDRVTAYGLLRNRPSLRLASLALTSEPFVIAAPMGAYTLMEQVNAALAEWQANRTLETLKARWL